MDREFSVGDVLRVRNWEDMLEEYETVRGGDSIVCPDNVWFVSTMKYLCGQEFEVKEIHYRFDEVTSYSSVDGLEGNYIITKYMLEYPNASEKRVTSYQEVNIEEFDKIIAQ